MGVIRYRRVDDVAGGMAELFKCCMRVFFGQEESVNILREGVTITFTRGVQLIFAEFDLSLVDSDAERCIWGIKGTSSFKGCARCMNVFDAKCPAK